MRRKLGVGVGHPKSKGYTLTLLVEGTPYRFSTYVQSVEDLESHLDREVAL